MKKLPVIIMFFLVASACSVKEDRTACPCWFSLDFTHVDPAIADSVGVSLHDAGDFFFEAIVPSSLYGFPYVVEATRSLISVCVVSADDGLFRPGKGLDIPLGEGCPALYMFTDQVDATYDSVVDTVYLHKNYCSLTIEMAGEGAEDSAPFQLGIKGRVSGYDDDGTPRKGDFLVVDSVSDEGACVVNVPRQTDSSLSLQVISTKTGKIVREFALGEFISVSGYDWEALDLGDVDVYIDFALAHITLKVEDWQTRFVYDVEI